MLFAHASKSEHNMQPSPLRGPTRGPLLIFCWYTGQEFLTQASKVRMGGGKEMVIAREGVAMKGRTRYDEIGAILVQDKTGILVHESEVDYVGACSPPSIQLD